MLTRVLFDLGLRRELQNYPKPLRDHLVTRRPITTTPDVSKSLEMGGLSSREIDIVILSHVHWDHIGTPTDFPSSHFIVGHGSLELLRSGADPAKTGSHAYYEPDLLPLNRTTELSMPERKKGKFIVSNGKNGVIHGLNGNESINHSNCTNGHLEIKDNGGSNYLNGANGNHIRNVARTVADAEWQKLAYLPNTLDLFSDGTVYIVDAPGHLQGHINILARTSPGAWVYLAGDACHDRRLMTKELAIATWSGLHGEICCIHVDKEESEKTIERIAALEKLRDQRVEVILAHDIEWLDKESNKKRFWPNKL